MNAFLLFPDRDADCEQGLPWNADALVRDLGLEAIMKAMSGDDRVLADIVPRVLLNGLSDSSEVLYRQSILRDCLANRKVVRSLYSLAGEALSAESRNYWGVRLRRADPIVRRSREVLAMFVDALESLCATIELSADAFESDGFKRFIAMLRAELPASYLRDIRNVLRQVDFRDGFMASAKLGAGHFLDQFTVRAYLPPIFSWFQRFFPPKVVGYTYYLHPRDESGARALENLRDRALRNIADVLGESLTHMLTFFSTLRHELGFYVSCINLYERLEKIGACTSFPTPLDSQSFAFQCEDLYDISLSLLMGRSISGNALHANGKKIIVVTGANQGGKSTFLRSVGISQLMMGAGLFVPARMFSAALATKVFTHFRREEDRSLESGKFDEELRRMNDIVKVLPPHALLLFNESFAATNDREGSEIALQIAEALMDGDVRTVFVTHLYEFAHRLAKEREAQTFFLRARRRVDDVPNFKLTADAALPTSFGGDLYHRIFGSS
ncbi:MAG: DNA mismatch repair protein MutS [Candidatus Eremiobacteraeota bacterium]|nr:DNA mismatch repair protein MutS [Candidatus Eremiobacteraeota bacterium]